MKKSTKAVIALLAWALLSGCASTSFMKQGEKDVLKPVNCATAQEDIKVLESEKVRIDQEVAAGATAILPIGAVLNVVQRKERQQWKVGFGEYNRMIDKKIAEIKQQCNIQ